MTPSTLTGLAKQFITIDQQQLAYLDVGDSALPVIVMVHGWLSHSRVWRHTIPVLHGRYRCIAVDLLGYGHSARPPGGDYSIAAQGRRVLALLDALGINRFTLLGHSMGGQISLCIAAQLAPQRVTRLIDVAGVTSGRLQPYPRYVVLPRARVAQAFPFLVGLSRAAARVSAYRRFEFYTWSLNHVPLAEWDEDVELVLPPGCQHAIYPSGKAIISTDLSNAIRAIQAPTLVIFGTADRVVPPSEGDLVAQQVADCRLVHLDGAGHFPMLECREQFHAALNTFLSEAG